MMENFRIAKHASGLTDKFHHVEHSLTSRKSFAVPHHKHEFKLECRSSPGAHSWHQAACKPKVDRRQHSASEEESSKKTLVRGAIGPYSNHEVVNVCTSRCDLKV